MTNPLDNARFPRSSRYHPDWVMENPFGANPLWLAEWLCEELQLRPGMRVLDLGCGRAKSSIFLAREFDVQVWAADLWIKASENWQRINDAGLQDRVFPIHADARGLPFAADFFDAITVIDSFSYFGSDDLFLNYLVQFVKPGGPLGMAGAGILRDFDGPVPEHLKTFWTQDCWCLHTSSWWRNHWERTGLVDIQQADDLPDAWRHWLQWAKATDTSNWYKETLESDAGQYLGYVRLIATRREDNELEDYCWPDTMRSLPMEYDRKPLDLN